MMELSEPELRQALGASLAVARWIDDVVAAGPFETAADVLRVAGDAAASLSPAEIDEALAHHPRIGERAVGAGHAQDFSRLEQAAPDAEDVDLTAAIVAGNAAYEKRFGRVFLIRAGGRTRAQIVLEQRRRLELDDRAELEIVGAELRSIALRRLATLIGKPDNQGTASPDTVRPQERESGGSMSQVTTHVLDAGLGRPAAGVTVTLERDGVVLARGATGEDGRVAELGPDALAPGTYRLVFDTRKYFAATARDTYYPSVTIDFLVTGPAAHHHVPLLLSQFAYSTYRGS